MLSGEWEGGYQNGRKRGYQSGRKWTIVIFYWPLIVYIFCFMAVCWLFYLDILQCSLRYKNCCFPYFLGASIPGFNSPCNFLEERKKFISTHRRFREEGGYSIICIFKKCSCPNFSILSTPPPLLVIIRYSFWLHPGLQRNFLLWVAPSLRQCCSLSLAFSQPLPLLANVLFEWPLGWLSK